MSEMDDQLELLRAAHRAVARYGIYRHRLAEDGYSRVNEPLDFSGLTWAEVVPYCDRMNQDARAKAGNPTDTWGLTQYYPRLETPLPPRWNGATSTIDITSN